MKRINGAVRKPIDWDTVRTRIAATMETRTLTREGKDRILAERARKLASEHQGTASAAHDLRLATFVLANEQYGIDAGIVIEIDRLFDYTPLPLCPAHLMGVTNLRGEILPLFDLRALLGIDRRPLNDLSRIVVLGHTRAEFGILADATRELMEISKADLLPPPASVSAEARRYIQGVTSDALIVLDGTALLRDKRLFMDGDDSEGDKRP